MADDDELTLDDFVIDADAEAEGRAADLYHLARREYPHPDLFLQALLVAAVEDLTAAVRDASDKQQASLKEIDDSIFESLSTDGSIATAIKKAALE